MGGGALTHSFIRAMRSQSASGLSYGHLLHSMRTITLQAMQQSGFSPHHQQFPMNHRKAYSNVRIVYLFTFLLDFRAVFFLSQLTKTIVCYSQIIKDTNINLTFS